MANFHEEPSKMEDYGYGQDRVDNSLIYANSATAAASTNEDKDGKKKRGPTRDFLDRLCTDVNYDLLVAKTFYFFFFAAFGSLFPLIAVYFKQLGMNPAQAGMLIGFRPFVELVAGPFWGNVAERWKKWKTVLLFSLFCWVVFTLALAFVQPPAQSCLVHNKTAIFVKAPYTISHLPFRDMTPGRYKRSTQSDHLVEDDLLLNHNQQQQYLYQPHWLPEGRMKRSASIEQESARENTSEEVGKRDADTRKDDDDDSDDDNDEDDDDDKEEEKDLDKNTASEQPIVKHHHQPERFYQFRQFPFPMIDKIGMSPLPLNHKHIANLDEAGSKNLVSPPLSAVVYRLQDIQGVFLELLILQILGEFLSTPALTMADTATLGYLEDDVENYGRQRMYGSFGWAIAMFFVGIALDHSNIFPNHPCGTEHLVDRNYMTCYAVFSVLMSCAFLTATQFRFKEVDSSFQNIPLSEIKGKVMEKVQQTLTQLGKKDDAATSEGPDGKNQKVHISLQDEEGRVKAGDMISDVQATADVLHEKTAPKPSTYVPRGQPGQAGTLPQWINVLKMFAPIQLSSMFFILWYMGFGIGLVFAFLFWHLQDLRGSPTLFGISSVINHVSEITAYFFIRNLVAKLGHLNIIYAGLIGNVARFIYISYLENPWWVLPFEFVQGLTHAGVWAAGCSYMTQSIPVNLRPTAQMILQSLHHAFGRGCGTIFGGVLINAYGTEAVFRGYGITCIFVLVGYFALNFFFIRHLPPIIGAPQPTNECDTEAAYLTPHGVPGGGIAHSLSNSRLDKGDGPPPYDTSASPKSNGFYDQGRSSSSQGYGDTGGPKWGGGDSYGGEYQYGYHMDPLEQSGKLVLNAKSPSNISEIQQQQQQQQPCSPEEISGINLIRRKFLAYDEAISAGERPITQKLILQMAPKPQTQTFLEQPESRDLSLMEDSTGNWLY